MGLLLALLVPLAAALTVYEDDFDAYTTSSLSGTGGWQTAYSSDTWSASGVDYIFAKTDDSGGTWGSGGAADNQLVYTTESWTDHSFSVQLYSNDDDCIGVSFRRQDASNFYLVLMAEDDGCPDTGTGARTTFSGSRLYRVSGGVATQLDSSSTRYTTSRWHDLQVDVDGSAITVWFDDDRNGVFEAADELLSATDATFSSGNIGLFCYDNGAPYGTAGGCAFDDVVVDQDDTDGDGVPDVDDVCPSASDASQTDTDGDGTGDACDTDADGDGATSTASGGTDCDDADASVNPSATESCSTTADDDCDGSTNDAGATGCTNWYADADADGYGTGSASCRCRATSTYSVSNASDCDDSSATVNPAATETCDDLDQDCDGAVDDGAVDPATWYVDADGDGYGDASGTSAGCDAPTGYVATGDDCNDLSAEVSPAGVEVCDGVDQDCDGATDEDAADASTWYADADGDGYGDPADSYVGCEAVGWVSGAGDCDPLDGTISPDALETCDGVDEDCDGEIDEEATDATVWYTDADGDGYGDDATAVYDCDGGGQGVNVGGDCDDGDAAVSPGEPERDDGLDQDCDGRADDGIDADGDGLDDDVEGDLGTDPDLPDTDGDGLDDGDEVDAGTDPNDPDDPGDDPGDTDDDPLDSGDPGVPGARTGGFYGGGCATPGVPASLAGALLAAAALTRRRR